VRVYLVTGATGVVGSAVAARLLADPDAALRLVVRGRDDDEAQSRLARLAEFWGTTPAALGRRVTAHRGDVTEPALGLAPAAHERLARETTHVIHCAAAVRMNLPLEEARRSAVAGTRNALAFAQACRREGVLRKVEVVSTVGVGGRRAGVLPEHWLDEPRAFHNTYEQSKAEAETVVRAELAHGMPITVHRPSMVVGDSRTGKIIHFQIFYHLAEFLSGRRTLGFCPAPGPTCLDIVPSDYVADAIAWSSTRTETAGRVLHLAAGPQGAMPIGDLRRHVRRAFAAKGLRVPPDLTVPASVFRRALPLMARLAPARNRRALAALPIFLDYLDEDQRFGNAETTALLEAAGIRLPERGATLDRVLDYYLRMRLP
jgi:thioester reductase-like protein